MAKEGPGMDRREPSTSMRPITPERFGYAEARHLLMRAGFGGSPDQIRALADMGPEAAVDLVLNDRATDAYPDPTMGDFADGLMREPTREEQMAYRRAREAQDEEAIAAFRRRRAMMERDDREQMSDMQRWWLRRMIESPRPMQEKMTLFWHGHFATGYRTIENSFQMYQQNLVFRRHALGNFGDLMFGIIRDPAMIRYLNNDRNRKEAPNENLARELMELFSLGEGHYEESDIKEGARALTGYTVDGNAFVFDERMHDGGNKRILGASGTLDGDGFVKAILAQRACAEFISLKLYRFFVRHPSEDGPEDRGVQSVVRAMASEMVRSRYEIKPVVRMMLLSEHFYDPSNRGVQIKSPAELVVGAVRTLGTPVRDLAILNDALGLMGQSLFHPPNVAGWAGGRTWINTSTLYIRQNVLNFLLTGKTPTGYDALAKQEAYDPSGLLRDLARSEPGAERDREKVVRYLLAFALGDSVSDARRETLMAFGGDRLTPDVVTGMVALITAMPEYQLC
jgi:uncharacterized protein (DUF1800 family)